MSTLNPAIPNWSQPGLTTSNPTPSYGNTDALSAAGLRKTIYLAARTDSVTGLGTAENPYDVGTPTKLAALWQELPTNADIIFARGSYDCNAYHDAGGGRSICLPLKAGQNIL